MMHSGAPLQGAGNQPLGHRRDFYTTKFPALCLWKSVVLNTILNATAIATVTQIAELRTTENMTLKGVYEGRVRVSFPRWRPSVDRQRP